jgi:hypothetical protein
MVSARNQDIQYSAFRPDPWGMPFFGPDPRMTLELRWLNPGTPLFNYLAFPAPTVEEDGSFYWILKPGDYLLLGNPRLFGSKQFNVGDTQALAHFPVPSAGGTIYLGTLVISIEYDLVDFIRSWERGEVEYEIHDVSVVDENEKMFKKIHTRFSAIPEPERVDLIRVEQRYPPGSTPSGP